LRFATACLVEQRRSALNKAEQLAMLGLNLPRLDIEFDVDLDLDRLDDHGSG
jgi:hypothetical protein